MLTEAHWTLLEPLVEVCSPRAKAPLGHLRHTIVAILWRHGNGAKWQALPAEHRPWWMTVQIFTRWARLSVWERLLVVLPFKLIRGLREAFRHWSWL